VRGADDLGPPGNPFHVREWQLDELDLLLRHHGLAPSFIGYTVNNDRDLQKRTILAIVDRRLGSLSDPPPSFRVEALLSCFNERDIAPAAVDHLLQQGVEVTVIDDWSTDGGWELLQERFGGDPRVRFVRHPEDAPNATYEWASILGLKQRLARASTADWIIHHDADELRTSPWPGTLRHALWNVQQAGFNAMNHTVADFRPVDGEPTAERDPETAFRWFEWGRRPGHFQQIKAWRQHPEVDRLVESGGHEVWFPGLRVAPYQLLLRHYPLRHPDQARRKVFDERIARFSPDERERGWHVQYDVVGEDDEFMWDRETLERFDPDTFDREFLTERLTGVGIVRPSTHASQPPEATDVP
jgi:hypothetical protein